ncbi:hypothetical protein ACWEKT_26915 [Nocardia takedensis]
MITAVNDELVSAAIQVARRYRAENGFEVVVGRHDDCILMRTGAVEAVQTRGDVGKVVWKLLSDSGLQTPIVENSDTDTWTFLTGPATETDEVCVYLEVTNPLAAPSPMTVRPDMVWVIRSVPGVQVALPGPTNPSRRWRCAPQGQVSRSAGLVAHEKLVELTRVAAGMVRVRGVGDRSDLVL